MGKEKEAPGDSSGDSTIGKRGTWGRQLDFMLSCIGYAVGLGNIWRFPYICYRNGGGAFLIPYVIMLAVAGLPLFFLELSLGQFTNYGATGIWKICPAFRGLGYAAAIISWLTAIYYNVIIVWSIFYIFASFTSSVVPWATCINPWNTANCLRRELADVNNCTANATRAGCTLTGNETTASSEYWNNYVLEITSGIDNLGGVRWQLFLCLIIAWIIVFFCLAKGIRSSGKVVYFTATFPYIVLVALLIRGATLPGSLNGIKFYMVPKWELLANGRVWADAASQIFYSLGPGWGGLVTFASYNRFHNNCYRDSIIVAVVNCGTSVFAGFAIFSVLGFMAREMGQPVSSVATSGSGLAFVVYPEGISRMPISPLWGILFFFMILTLGLDTQFTMLETAITAIVDEYPRKLRKHKTLVTFVVCVISLIAGIPCITQGGGYVLNLMDWFIGAPSLLIVGFFEPIVIVYFYGLKRFCEDVELMTGFQPNYYWRACWAFITPAALLFMVVNSGLYYITPVLGSYTYPPYAEAVGWVLCMASVVCIPIFLCVTFISELSSCPKFTRCIQGRTDRSVLKRMFGPPDNWGPAVGNDGMIDGLEPAADFLERREKELKEKEAELNGKKPYLSEAAFDNPTFDSLPASLY